MASFKPMLELNFFLNFVFEMWPSHNLETNARQRPQALAHST